MTPTDHAPGARRPSRLSLLIAAAVATTCIGVGAASAQTPDVTGAEAIEQSVEEQLPGEPTTPAEVPANEPTSDDGAEPVPAEEEAGNDAAKQRGQGGRLRLLREEVRPKKLFWAGIRKATFEYKFAGQRTADLVIEVMKQKQGDDPMVKRFREDGREAEKKYELKWDGRRSNGDSIKAGKFYFLVSEAQGQRLKRDRAKGERTVRIFPAIFPVQGKHQYWDGWGAGRGHQGQDIGAKCGTRMVAAEPGTVTTKAYNGGGYGYYVVIDVRGSNRSEVYGHLKNQAAVRQGEKVKTGERIGAVGATGNASGCHLHFEYRPNGTPSPVATRKLRTWDKYS